MKLKIAQIVGLNTDQKAAQVLSEQREEEAFLGVLNLSCDDAFTKGRQILSELSDFYFDLTGAPAEKLSNTFEESKKKFTEDPDFDLCLGLLSGKALYLIGKGSVEVYLRRSDNLSPLLSIGSKEQIISGFVQAGDRILLSTESLITFLGPDLEKFLELPLDSFEEEISSKVVAGPLPESEVPQEQEETEGTSSAQGLAGLAIDIEPDQESSQEEEIIPALPKEESPRYEEIEDSSGYGKEPTSSVIKSISGKVVLFLRKLIANFPKSGRARLIIALILVLLLAGGIGLQYKNSKDKEKNLQFSQDLQGAKDEFSAAKGLSSINPKDAKDKLDSAKSKIKLALSLYPNNSEAKDLQKQIEDQSGSILQQSQAKDFPLFLDLDLIKKNFRAQSLSLSAGKLLVLDPVQKTLAVIDLSKKSNEILAGSDQLGDGSFASLNGGLAFIYSKDKGVLRVDITNQKVTTVAKTDKDWGNISDIYGFGSNIYLLDKTQIWKYLPTSDGYSDKKEYLTSATKADFTNALRLQIESSVYVLKPGGEILRFTRGEKDNFSLGGLDKNVKDPKSLFVSSDTDNLYLLDSGNARLLILTKTGDYKGQISGDKFATASDLVVDEKSKRVYLLDGSKIYAVDLK